MRHSEKIVQAAAKLAALQPHNQITYADVAKEAGVHWTTVKRLFGDKENMRKALKEYAAVPSRADTRTLILQSAARIFAKFGYAGSTLDQIAQDAGMTKGAVYWHFSSKSDLYLELCDRSLKKLLERLPQHAREVFRAADPEHALKQLLQSEFELCEQENGERTLLFFEFIASMRDPAVKDKLQQSFSTLLDGTAAILAEMQKDRLISTEQDPKSLAVMLHSLVNGVVLMRLVAPNQVSFQSLAEEIAKALWQGLQPAAL